MVDLGLGEVYGPEIFGESFETAAKLKPLGNSKTLQKIDAIDSVGSRF